MARTVTWLVVFSTVIAAISPVHASESNHSEGKITATLQALDISAARVTFRDNQTAEARTLHVPETKAPKRMAKMKEGQELCLKYRLPPGATEPEIIGMSRTGDGWKRGAK